MGIQKNIASFDKNSLLEKLLGELEDVLAPAEDKLVRNQDLSLKANVFIVGSPRSGTTLLYQALAASGGFCFPTNFLSRFYASLGIGCKIQKMLFSHDCQYKEEMGLIDKCDFTNFSSELGKTKGVLSPNVFWYFWYYHFKFGDKSYLNEQQWKSSNTNRFVAELGLMQKELGLPIVMKAMVLNWNLLQLSQLMPSAIFLRIKREPIDVVSSLYEARKLHSGSYNKWWSFKPPEYEQLINLSAREQVVAFYLSIDNALDASFKKLSDKQIVTVSYDDFCERPNELLHVLEKRFTDLGGDISLSKLKPFKKSCRRTVDDDKEWRKAFEVVPSKVKFNIY